MNDKIESLDKEVQFFIQQYHSGKRTLSELVSREAADTRGHITSEVASAEKLIKQHVSAEVSRSERLITKQLTAVTSTSSVKVQDELRQLKFEAKNVAERQRLLNSFKFPGMNERRNQISENHESTFQWVYKEPAMLEESQESDDEVSGVKESRRYVWDSFPAWLRSSEPVYWVNGKPGSGKTTLLYYLIQDSETRASLNLWMPGALILSHFFWRPGTSMQRNLKGFLCSFLHQLISKLDNLTHVLLQKYDDMPLKETDTDWSIRELRKLCLEAVKLSNKPVCLFLDGVDELDSQEGVLDLLDFLYEMKATPRFKMCLSSRLEEPLHNRLHHFPHLRIHDLTRGDLQKYANETIRLPYCSQGGIREWQKSDIVHRLVTKADGVFLWLCLAVSSVNRGISNGDDYSTLFQRIDSLPGDLVNLYKDMWARMNDDRGIYRQKAALYFNTVIACRQFFAKDENRSAPRSFMGSAISVLEMRLATIPPREDFFSTSTGPTAATLLKQCQNTEKSLRICCAGFLEIVENPNTHKDLGNCQFQEPSYKPLIPYIAGQRTIQFLHRTAFDFMTDTVEGREILDSDTTSIEILQLRMMRASIAVRQICLYGGLWWIGNPTQLQEQTSFCGSIEVIMEDLSYIHDRIEPDEVLRQESRELVNLCERIYRVAQPFAERWRRFSGEFLTRAAAYNLGEWVPEEMRARSASMTPLLKSLILMSSSGVLRYYRTPSMLKLMRQLLDMGCDPNWRNSSFANERALCLVESSFSHFLRTNLLLWKPNMIQLLDHFGNRHEYIEEIPKTLDAFIAHGANLGQKVLVAFEVSSEGEIAVRYPLEIWHKEAYSDFVLMEFPASFLVQALRKKLEAWKPIGEMSVDWKPKRKDPKTGEYLPAEIDDDAEPAGRVIAAVGFKTETGAHHTVAGESSRHLTLAMEAWLSAGLQDVAMMLECHKRARIVCESSEKFVTGKDVEDVLIELGYAQYGDF